MLSFLPVSLSVALLVSSPYSTDALLTSPTRHVRATDGHVQRLLAIGLARSQTFRTLMLAVEASDVIVYIQPVGVLSNDLAGQILLLPGPGPQRYLRIQVTIGGTVTDRIALIGHELRHALEIADAGNVHDEESLAALYQRIGHRGPRANLFDTEAARVTGLRVRHELLT
jgi:hypothetical protein